MSIGSIAPVGTTLPQPITTAEPAAKPAAAPAAAAPARTDADGDHDGSTGTLINVKA